MKRRSIIFLCILSLCSNILSAQIYKSLYVPTPCLSTMILEEKSSESQLVFDISPNPTKGSFTVRFLQEKIIGDITVSLLNEIGQKIYEKKHKISDRQFTFEDRNIDQGIYMFRIIKGNMAVTKKIIIIH